MLCCRTRLSSCMTPVPGSTGSSATLSSVTTWSRSTPTAASSPCAPSPAPTRLSRWGAPKWPANLDGGPDMAPQPPTLGAARETRAAPRPPNARSGPGNPCRSSTPQRSERPGKPVPLLDRGAPRLPDRLLVSMGGCRGPDLLSGFDHGPLRAAVRADAERQRKRPIRPKPVRHHADLTRRQVDRAGKTVGADEPGVLPQELVDQVVRCIHSLTIRIASRTLSSGPEMRSRAPSRSAVVSRMHSRGEHQVAMVSLRPWRSRPKYANS